MTLFIGTLSIFVVRLVYGNGLTFGFRPENILYRNADTQSDIVIADFGM